MLPPDSNLEHQELSTIVESSAGTELRAVYFLFLSSVFSFFFIRDLKNGVWGCLECGLKCVSLGNELK